MIGICLRGPPGWGENLAPIDTVINTFGGRWFNLAWQAQMTTPEMTRAVSSYVSMLQKYGEPGAPEDGFSECGTHYARATRPCGTTRPPRSAPSRTRRAARWPAATAIRGRRARTAARQERPGTGGAGLRREDAAVRRSRRRGPAGPLPGRCRRSR